MLPILLMVASVADWVPMRWVSAEPASLDLLTKTPVNCLLLETGQWALADAAGTKGLATLGVLRPGQDALQAAQLAAKSKLTGVVLEGEFPAEVAARVRAYGADTKLAVVELPLRRAIRFEGVPIVGTFQGVWPGVRVTEDGKHHAAPSGAPWIDTNSGFLRFVRSATAAPVWVAELPPAAGDVPVARYLQAIGDAAMVGARWVVALDSEFSERLAKREARALKGWAQIAETLRYFEDNREWRDLQPYGKLALVQDVESGALFSGGVLDMIAVKHTPVRPIPVRRLREGAMAGAQMAVNVDPKTLTPEQREVLRTFTRAGGTLLTGPPDWKMPSMKGTEITLGETEVKMLDDIWKETNQMTGRRNLGARLFNVSSMLSSLLTSADGSRTVLHLVNYSDYPVESVTVHLLGKHSKVMLHSPDAKPVPLTPYEIEEGIGIDIDKVGAVATLVVE